jgi:hypothetical protein
MFVRRRRLLLDLRGNAFGEIRLKDLSDHLEDFFGSTNANEK